MCKLGWSNTSFKCLGLFATQAEKRWKGVCLINVPKGRWNIRWSISKNSKPFLAASYTKWWKNNISYSLHLVKCDVCFSVCVHYTVFIISCIWARTDRCLELQYLNGTESTYQLIGLPIVGDPQLLYWLTHIKTLTVTLRVFWRNYHLWCISVTHFYVPVMCCSVECSCLLVQNNHQQSFLHQLETK